MASSTDLAPVEDAPEVDAPFCSECGTQATPAGRFCVKCGTPLSLRRGTTDRKPWYRRRKILISIAAVTLVLGGAAAAALLLLPKADIAQIAQAPFMDRIAGQWTCSSDDGATAKLDIAPGTFVFDTASPSGLTASLRGTWEVQGWKVRIHTTEGGLAPDGFFTPVERGDRFELVTENPQGTINSELAKPFLELKEDDHTAILRFTFNGRRVQVVCGQ